VVLSFWWWSSRKKRRARKKLDGKKLDDPDESNIPKIEIPATVEERLRNYEGNGDTMMTQCDWTLQRTLPIPEAFRGDSGNVRSRKGSATAVSLGGSGDFSRFPEEVVDTPM